MPIPFILQLVLGVALSIVGYMLRPKPKAEKPPSLKDFDNPTADAGRPIPVVFGSMTIKGVNVIYSGQKRRVMREMTKDAKK